jgi:hypothetical protein
MIPAQEDFMTSLHQNVLFAKLALCIVHSVCIEVHSAYRIKYSAYYYLRCCCSVPDWILLPSVELIHAADCKVVEMQVEAGSVAKSADKTPIKDAIFVFGQRINQQGSCGSSIYSLREH